MFNEGTHEARRKCVDRNSDGNIHRCALGDGSAVGLGWKFCRSGSGDGTGLARTSSSRMPLLKDLIPSATSPISPEIFPRPNNRTTTAMTIIQCIMLISPIGRSFWSCHAWEHVGTCASSKTRKAED